MAITLSEAAATEIKRHMQSQGIAEDMVLRMGIAGGGCAGLQYTLGFQSDYDPAVDVRYEQHGIPIVAKKKVALFLEGTKIEFQDGPMGRGFTVDNPTVPKGGGCPGCGGA